MKINYFVKGQCDIELGNSFNLGTEVFNLVKNNQISQEDLGYYFAGVKDYIKQRVSRRNMQIKELKKHKQELIERLDYAQLNSGKLY